MTTTKTTPASLTLLSNKRILDCGGNKTHMLTLIEIFNLIPAIVIMRFWDDAVSMDDIPPFYMGTLIVGVFAGGLGKIFHIYAISLGGVANTVPFITLSPVVSVLLGMPMNGEYPESGGIFGVLMICTGAAALALARAGDAANPNKGDPIDGSSLDSPDSPIKSAEELEIASRKSSDEVKGMLCMLVVALLWAVSASCQKIALKKCPFTQVTVITNSIMVPFFAFFSWRLWRHEFKARITNEKDEEEVELKTLLGETKEAEAGVVLSKRSEDEADMKHRVSMSVEYEGEEVVEVKSKRLMAIRWMSDGFNIVTKPIRGYLVFPDLMQGIPHYYLATGLIEVFTVSLYFLAMRYLYVSYLLALKRGGSVVLSVMGGAFFFGEPVAKREKICIALMFAGVILVVAS